MKVWILALFNGIIIVQSQGYRKGDKKSYRWQVTPFQPCRDKLACDLEYRRYCPGDPSGRKCGSEIKQTLYYKSLSGCTADPKTCKKWNTISATKCNGTRKFLSSFFMQQALRKITDLNCLLFKKFLRNLH